MEMVIGIINLLLKALSQARIKRRAYTWDRFEIIYLRLANLPNLIKVKTELERVGERNLTRDGQDFPTYTSIALVF